MRPQSVHWRFGSRGKNRRLWSCLGVALALHAMLLIAPFERPGPADPKRIQLVDVRLAPPASPRPLPRRMPAAEPHIPALPVAPPRLDTMPATAPRPAESRPAPTPAPPPQVRVATETILARQFLREPTVTERIFGKPVRPSVPPPRAEFALPDREDMFTLLDRPLPDVPFAYEPGLVRFAYEPGLRGDIQRFWDVLTPEFGWRTRNGTEVRCIWLLVVGACAWK